MRQSASWHAPGRVNLIGEHTDYNDGFTLPLAIGYGCTATLTRTAEPVWVARSAQVEQPWRCAAGTLDDRTPGWARYVLGGVSLLHSRGLLPPGGIEVSVDSDVPLGAGLSSSAALVCSVVTALDDLLGLRLGPDAVLALSREVENVVVGAPTGGMDQMASLRAVAGHVLLCDMGALTSERVPFDPAAHGLRLLVVDSRTPHAHADGEYAARRAGCDAAAAALGVPSLRTLTDAAEQEPWADRVAALPADLARLARHVASENERVLRTAQLLREGRLGEIGPLLTASHASMRDDFRITVDRVDVAVESLLASGALGARMTGGGFGGCVVALVGAELVEPAVAALEEQYAARGWERPVGFVVEAVDGARPA